MTRHRPSQFLSWPLRPGRWRLAAVAAPITAASLVAGTAGGASAHVNSRSWFQPGR
jgi:hypothetical protein